MPIIAEIEPEATPKSTARMAPASSPISRTSRPSGERRMRNQPPPPMNGDRSVNGRSRVQKLKPTVTVLPRNGTWTSAPSDMFERLKTPTATFGSARVKPADEPLRR